MLLKKIKLVIGIPAALLALPMVLISNSAMAAGTLSNTSISNTATIDFKVNNISQDSETTNAATFKVDNKVNLTIVSNGDRTSTPGSSDQVLSFTLSNIGNTSQGYVVEALAAAGDTQDMSNLRIYRDVNGDSLLDAGDTLYTSGTNIGDLAPDTSMQVLIVGDSELAFVDGDTSAYDLQATTLDAGTTTVTTDDAATAEDATVVQNVLADGNGSIDIAKDGKFSATSTYNIASAALTVSKTATVISDPFNATANPKAIPGAVVRYSISIENTSTTTPATEVTMVDVIPDKTTYLGSTITLDSVSKTDSNADSDGADQGATNANAVTVVVDTLAANATAVITFDVTID